MKPWEQKLAVTLFGVALLIAFGIKSCHGAQFSDPLCPPGAQYVKQRVDTWARVRGGLRIVRSVWVCKSYEFAALDKLTKGKK